MSVGRKYRDKRSKGNFSIHRGETKPQEKDYEGRFPLSVLEFPSQAAFGHPTEKPIDLIRYLVATYSNPGQLVLDNCMGSWTTARACKDLGRNFIGFELEEKYCKVGEERLRQENLF